VIVMVITAPNNARVSKLSLTSSRQSPGIFIYRNTSLYIRRNEVELSLGTNVEVYARSITLTCS
jgi:hypothetical protein